MSFLKDIFRGDPAKSAAKHEQRARANQKQGNEKKAAWEWAAAGRDYARIPDLKRAHDAFMQSAQFHLATGDINQEKELLYAALDAAIESKDFQAAIGALHQVTRVGTRLKDMQLLLNAYALMTIAFIAGNDLSKAKETYREALKVEKRLGRIKTKNPTYQIASVLFKRFIEGEEVPDELKLPKRVDESEKVNQLITALLTLYNETKDSTLELKIEKTEVKIKDSVAGSCLFSFPVPVRIVDTQFTLPSSIALLDAIKIPSETKNKYQVNFVLEPHLPGDFEVGPLLAVLQVNGQQFQLKSNTVMLQVAAAKPHIAVSVAPTANPFSQEEFELVLRIENNGHGDATDVNILVSLPPTLLLKTGTLEKRIATIPAQQLVQFPLFLIATKAGDIEGMIECHFAGPSGRRTKLETKFVVEVHHSVQKEKD